MKHAQHMTLPQPSQRAPNGGDWMTTSASTGALRWTARAHLRQ
jgi:hypothetical protein